MSKLIVLLLIYGLSGGVACADANAKDRATRLFELYRAHDVAGMVGMFSEAGVIEYVPLNLTGPASEIGPGSWGVLTDAFPDLTNEINQVWQDETGRVAFVDVHIGGTQSKEVFGIPSQGKSFWLRHLFVFETNEDGEIDKVTSFWDNAEWFRQLGKVTLE